MIRKLVVGTVSLLLVASTLNAQSPDATTSDATTSDATTPETATPETATPDTAPSDTAPSDTTTVADTATSDTAAEDAVPPTDCGALNEKNRQIAEWIASDKFLEAELAKLAVERAANESIKEHAASILARSQKAIERLELASPGAHVQLCDSRSSTEAGSPGTEPVTATPVATEASPSATDPSSSSAESSASPEASTSSSNPEPTTPKTEPDQPQVATDSSSETSTETTTPIENTPATAESPAANPQPHNVSRTTKQQIAHKQAELIRSQLTELSGTEFDQTYLAFLLWHQQAVSATLAVIGEEASGELREYIQSEQAHLETDIAKTKDARAKLCGQNATAPQGE